MLAENETQNHHCLSDKHNEDYNHLCHTIIWIRQMLLFDRNWRHQVYSVLQPRQFSNLIVWPVSFIRRCLKFRVNLIYTFRTIWICIPASKCISMPLHTHYPLFSPFSKCQLIHFATLLGLNMLKLVYTFHDRKKEN